MPSSQPLPTSPAGHPWARLPLRERRGSRARCILLTDGPADVVAHRLSELAAPAIIDPARHHWMPRGFAQPKEAKLGDALQLLSSEHREAVTQAGGAVCTCPRGELARLVDHAKCATL